MHSKDGQVLLKNIIEGKGMYDKTKYLCFMNQINLKEHFEKKVCAI